MTGIEIKLIYDILLVTFTMFCGVSLLFDGLSGCKNMVDDQTLEVHHCGMLSISSTFYASILHGYFGTEKVQTQKNCSVIFGQKI